MASEHYTALIAAIQANDVEAIGGVLAHAGLDPTFSPSRYDAAPLVAAVRAGSAPCVRALLAHPRVDPTTRCYEAFTVSAKCMHWDVFDLLLQHPKADAGAGGAFLLRLAAQCGAPAATVRTMLAHPSVQPSTWAWLPLSACVNVMSRGGGIALEDFQLPEPGRGGTDPSLPSRVTRSPIEIAAHNGHAAVVECMLADPRLDRAYASVAVLCGAAAMPSQSQSAPAVLQRLLAHRLIDPTARVPPGALDTPRRATGPVRTAGDNALGLAAWLGRADAVEVLLADGRIDPSANANTAVRAAALFGNVAALDCLLNDPRVDPLDARRAVSYGSFSASDLVSSVAGDALEAAVSMSSSVFSPFFAFPREMEAARKHAVTLRLLLQPAVARTVFVAPCRCNAPASLRRQTLHRPAPGRPQSAGGEKFVGTESWSSESPSGPQDLGFGCSRCSDSVPAQTDIAQRMACEAARLALKQRAVLADDLGVVMMCAPTPKRRYVGDALELGLSAAGYSHLAWRRRLPLLAARFTATADDATCSDGTAAEE